MGRRPKAGPPKIVVLRCDHCGHPIGNRGYLAVDRVSAMERRAGVERSGSNRSGGANASNWSNRSGGVTVLDRQIFWRIVHTGCDVEPRTTDYRIASGRFTTTGDLLEATAYLMRAHPWVIETNWSGLIGRVLADTRQTGETERQTTPRRTPHAALAADDPRHGTVNGYTNWRCRCDRCTAASSAQKRSERARQNGETEKPANTPDRPNGAQRGDGKTDGSDKQEGTDDD